MKRRWFNLTAALSLVFAIAIGGLWIRSYWPDYAIGGWGVSLGGFGNFPFGVVADGRLRADNFRIRFGDIGYVAMARRGGLEFYWQELRRPGMPRLAVGSMYARVDETVLGFGLNRAPSTPTQWGGRWASQGTLRVPFWFLIALALTTPVTWMVRFIRRRRSLRRVEHGLCPSCGYDLCATPGRCPECGMEAG